jgi:hypothetical protein
MTVDDDTPTVFGEYPDDMGVRSIGDMARCRECRSDIPADATRCPICDYDPSPGYLALLGLLVFGPMTGVGVLLAVSALAGLAVGALSLAQALGGLGATVVVFSIPALYVRWYNRRRQTTAGDRET